MESGSVQGPSSHCILVGPRPHQQGGGEGWKGVWTPWEMKQPSGLPTGAAADRGKLRTSKRGAGQSEPGDTQNFTHRPRMEAEQSV